MIKGKIKATFAVFAILVMALLAVTVVSAIEFEDRTDGNFTRNDDEDVLNQGTQPKLNVVWVKVDGDIVENGDEIRLSLERNEEIEIKIELMALADIEDVAMEAEIYGDDHYQIDDQTETFDVVNQTLYIKTLNLKLPDIMDRDEYDLRVTVAPRTGAVKTYNYLLRIDAQEHQMIIKDVTLNPENEVKAGRALLSVVRVRNVGEKTEDSVKVKVSIPELGISAVDYIDDIEPDDSVSSEELYMRIPSGAESGTYTVKIDVEYDEGFETERQTLSIDVVGESSDNGGDSDDPGDNGQTPSDKTTITVGSQTQDLKQGEGGVIYPITLSNEGSNSKTYTIGVAGTDTFAEVRVSPSTLVVVEGGETETVYIYLTARESSQVGSYTFSVDVSSNGDSLKQIPLNANVVEGDGSTAEGWDSVKKGLQIGLIILIVLLVILGLIIAFSKMKGGDEDEDDEGEVTGQTYY
ncbi:hypothetical protein ACFL6I_20395 [candidate division KSB1 bacterium]